jgi:transcriptional regulator with XRE-family HTH domain
LERKLTQEEFAELIGISVDFLSLIERGINAPSFEVLEQMASALELTVRDLFDFRKLPANSVLN